MFPAEQRGLAMSIFAAAPFLGPTIGKPNSMARSFRDIKNSQNAGPIIGGFLGETEGWRWVEGLMAIFTGALWIIGALTIPETYSPVILRRRAAKLSKLTGKIYKSRMEVENGKKTASQEFKTALSRPWILLFLEPIVLLLSIYMAIIYGTLYMLFSAFPIVYQENRGWSQGIGGLSFIGVMLGMIIAVCYSIWDNKRYRLFSEKCDGKAPPEARLPPSMVGSICLPIGMFWFAVCMLFPDFIKRGNADLLVLVDELPKHSLERKHHRYSTIRLRHGLGVFEHHELPHRCLRYIRRICSRS
jgi:MFS family permease